MKKSLQIFLTVLSLSAFNANAQDKTEFKPSGKPEALIFTNFANVSSGGASQNKFEITRAYIGYSYNFSPEWSGRALIDAGNQGIPGYNYSVFLKFGYLQYAPKNLVVKFGMISTTSFDVQEKIYGYRYIMKTFQDQYGMNPSADLGISATYKFNDIFSADLIIENGEGYKINDVDSVLKAGVGVTVHPVKQLTLRGYYDNTTKGSAALQTTSLFAGYTGKNFSLGIEYNDQIDYKLKSSQDWSGISIFGNCNINNKFDLFARYDHLASDKIGNASTAWNFAKDGQMFMAGLQFIPIKGIRIAPNYQLWKPRDNSKSNISTVIVNVEIRM